MRPFHLERGMLTMRGVFYPTGYMVLMFPGEQQARDAARLLVDKGVDGGKVMLLTPADIQEHIARSSSDDQEPLQSVGTESATARHFGQLAARGQHGLMIHAPSAEDCRRVMELLRATTVTYGQKYRHLVIEDLVENKETPERV